MKLVEEQFHVGFVAGLLLEHSLTWRLAVLLLEFDVHLRLVFSVVEPRQRESILVQEFKQTVVLNLLQYLLAFEALDPEIEVAHEQHVLVMNDRHFPLAEILLKSAIENLHELLGPLIVFAAATREVAVDDHEALVFDFKANANGSFVAAHARSTGLDSAGLERLRRDASCEFPFQKYRQVASHHLLVRVNQLLIVELLFRARSPSRIDLVGCLHRLGEHCAPHFQLLLVRDHHILSSQGHHFLQSNEIHIWHKSDLLTGEILNLENGQQLFNRVRHLAAAVESRAVDVDYSVIGFVPDLLLLDGRYTCFGCCVCAYLKRFLACKIRLVPVLKVWRLLLLNHYFLIVV